MNSAVVESPDRPASLPSSTLAWLTPTRCRIILVLVLAAGFIGHWRYLNDSCPIDLSGDEAHYWDWSRQLDWCYYSKGPMVALLIRGSCSLLGDTMPAVRFPALLLAIGTTMLTYWLAAHLLKSERLALGAALLSHLVPMFIAGSVLMTIDAPFFFFWALATCAAAKAHLDQPDQRTWPWLLVGLAVGLGFLAKFTMLIWFAGLFAFFLFDPDSRRLLRSPGPWLALGIALVFTIPVLFWNSQHDWVSLRHVAKHTGTAESSKFEPLGILTFLGGQIGAVGPFLAIIMAAATFFALKRRTAAYRRQTFYLAVLPLPLWLSIGLVSFWTRGGQVNWPAPAYFTLIILSAAFLAERYQDTRLWKRWSVLLWGAIAFGLLLAPLSHHTHLLYPSIAHLSQRLTGKAIEPRRWDPSYRLRGWQELGDHVSALLENLSPDPMVIAEQYQTTAQLAFYVRGQPRTFYVGSWFADPQRRSRLTQYDLWQDRRLDQPQLRGRDAIFCGYEPPPDLRAAFEQVEKLPPLEISRGSIKVRIFQLWRCHGFKGMQRHDGHFDY